MNLFFDTTENTAEKTLPEYLHDLTPMTVLRIYLEDTTGEYSSCKISVWMPDSFHYLWSYGKKQTFDMVEVLDEILVFIQKYSLTIQKIEVEEGIYPEY